MLMRPSPSAYCGTSQPWRLMPSSVASGKKKAGGMPSVWASTTLVILVRPTCHRRVRSVTKPTLRQPGWNVWRKLANVGWLDCHWSSCVWKYRA